MSVAFRRESDEDHKEPTFELPIPAGPNWVTARGLALIADEVARLTAAVPVAPTDEARKVVQRDLRYWQTRLSTAQLAPVPAAGEVAIGATVRFTLNGRARTLTITGHDEADPAHDRIGFAAPLARAMVGASVGDSLAYQGVDDAITILTAAPTTDAGAA
jgi:transcription elongation GreA/GreB family factor